MLIYCMKCKEKTESKDYWVTPNPKSTKVVILHATCVKSGTKKATFCRPEKLPEELAEVSPVTQSQLIAETHPAALAAEHAPLVL